MMREQAMYGAEDSPSLDNNNTWQCTIDVTNNSTTRTISNRMSRAAATAMIIPSIDDERTGDV